MGLGRVLVGLGAVVGGLKVIHDGIGKPATLREAPATGPERTVRGDNGLTVKIYRIKSLVDRIEHVRERVATGAIDPTIIEFTRRVLGRKCGGDWCVPEKNYDAETDAIFYAWRQNVRYVLDPVDVDLFQHPARTLQLRGGDCDDYSIGLAASLRSAGYPAWLRVVQTKDSNDWNHIYVVVGLPPHSPTRAKALDASENRGPGWEVPASVVHRFRDFRVS